MSHTREYLEAALEKAKALLPEWAWRAIHAAALPSAGGRAAHREPEEPAVLEKLAVADMRPSVLREVPDEELSQAHHRLHQLYGAAKKAGRSVEIYVNAHLFVEAEMRQRGMNIAPDDELSAEAEKLKKAAPLPELWDLPDEILVVPGFASLVGSTLDKGAEANDVDVLLRASWTYRDHEDSPYLLVQAHSVTLPLRKVLDPDKTGRIHWVPSPQGPHADAVELYDLVLRRRPVFRRQTVKAEPSVRPGHPYPIQKPSMAFFTDFRDVEELWEYWAAEVVERRGSILVSPKIDGYRLSLHSTGQLFSEDFKRNYADALPDLAKAVRDAGMDFIVEGELQARREGRYLSRSELAAMLAGSLQADPVVYLYDILYAGEDMSGRPFRERLAALRRVAGQLGPPFKVLPQVEVRTKDGLRRTANMLLRYGPPVEGIVTRDPEMPYRFGATNDYAKTKTYIELKVQVTQVRRTANGYTYTGALSGDDGQLVELGDTFVSQAKLAEEGDILNVRIEELERKADGTLAWHKPTPLDVDKSRKTPYRVEQAVELARRFGRYSESPLAKQEAPPDEEGDERGPRAEAAARYWRENWWRALPRSGRGRWALHGHWRGLSEEEAKLDFDDLLKTDHSLHFDLRLEGEDGLFGWSIFAGTTAENRPTPRIFRLGSEERMQVAPKLLQPREWLDVGRRAPLVVEPGGVGSTSQKWSKFFRLDGGTYELGVANRHFVEIFLNGGGLKGRYLIQSAEQPGRRFWVLTKPDDQRPYAETHDLEKVKAELRQRGHEVLVWGKPGERPQIIGLREVQKWEHIVPIWFNKADPEQRIVYGVVLVPGVPDSQGDVVAPEDIEKAAHDFLARSRRIQVQHERPAKAEVVESYIAPADLVVAGRRVSRGSWVMAVHVLDDELWSAVKSGRLTGFSVGGTGVREEMRDEAVA